MFGHLRQDLNDRRLWGRIGLRHLEGRIGHGSLVKDLAKKRNWGG
jgi:hypothetical protein